MKRRNLPTRRRRAIRRVALAAVLLILMQHCLSVGNLLPIQAVYKTGQRQGIGWSWPIQRMAVPEIDRTHLLYLTGNENAVMLADTNLSILGWSAHYGLALDCTGGDPLYAGYRSLMKGQTAVTCYFGRIDRDDIASIAISIQEETYRQSQVIHREVRRLTAEQEDLLTRDGHRYFLLKEVDPEWDVERILRPVILAYGADGTVLLEQEIDRYASSSYG